MRAEDRIRLKFHPQDFVLKGLMGVGVASIALVCGMSVGAHAAVSTHPDFSGTYLKINGPGDRAPSFELTTEGQRAYERNQAGIEVSDPEIDTALKCEPQGVPRTVRTVLPFIILQTPGTIGMVWESFMQPRLIRMASEHRKGYWPTYMGDAIAHWEGDTLVIDTVNFVTTTFLDPRGLPHSDALHVIERMTMSDDGKTYQNEVTIDDKKYFKAPWTAVYTFEKQDDLDIVETVCENTRIIP